MRRVSALSSQCQWFVIEGKSCGRQEKMYLRGSRVCVRTEVYEFSPAGTEFGNGVLTHAWCECCVACMKPCPSLISATRKLVAIPTGADQRKRPDLCSAKRSLEQLTGYPPIWTARHSTPYPLGSHRYVQGATYAIGYTPMFCLATIQGARRIRDAGISWVVKKLRRVDSDV